MPILPKSDKCSQLGCTNIRSRLNTYCTEHGGKNTIDTDKRKEFVSMYQTTQWRTLRQVMDFRSLLERIDQHKKRPLNDRIENERTASPG